MAELPHAVSGRKRWLTELAAAGWTLSVIMGIAGLGLIGGLAYGAWVASQTPRASPTDDFFVSIAWLVCPVLYGAIGFVGGLAAGLLVLITKWIVRLAKRIVRSWEENRTKPA
jgi:hypothetical protein